MSSGDTFKPGAPFATKGKLYDARVDLVTQQALREAIQVRYSQRQEDKLNCADEEHGVVVFCDDIDEDSAVGLSSYLRQVARLLVMHGLAPRIQLLLTSPGGQMVPGFALMDSIRALKIESGVEVDIAVRGEACSMAAVMLQGATGIRTIGLNSSLMLHRASFAAAGDADSVEDGLGYVKMLESRVYDILASRSNHDAKWWKRKLGGRKDCWFTAQEALEVGLVDLIA